MRSCHYASCQNPRLRYLPHGLNKQQPSRMCLKPLWQNKMNLALRHPGNPTSTPAVSAMTFPLQSGFVGVGSPHPELASDPSGSRGRIPELSLPHRGLWPESKDMRRRGRRAYPRPLSTTHRNLHLFTI